MKPAFVAIALVACVLLGWSGCVSNEPGSTSTAHAVVEGATVDEIRDELVRVFEADYYTVDRTWSSGAVFSRPATQRDVVMFGELGGGSVTMRVKVSIKPHGRSANLVLADVHADYSGGGSRDVGVIGSRPYQALLDQAAANLVRSRAD